MEMERQLHVAIGRGGPELLGDGAKPWWSLSHNRPPGESRNLEPVTDVTDPGRLWRVPEPEPGTSDFGQRNRNLGTVRGVDREGAVPARVRARPQSTQYIYGRTL